MARRQRPYVLRASLAVLAVVALVAVLGIAAALLLIDPNRFRPQIMAAARQATGRELLLRGPIHIGLSLPPTLVVDDVTLANVTGGSRPWMATLERLEVRVALLPLLGGRLDVVRLDLIRPDVLLETDAAGRGNWQFGPEKAAAPVADAPTPAPAPKTGSRVALRAFHVRDGHVAWRDGRTGRSAEVSVPRLDVVGGGPANSLVISGIVASAGRTLTLSGETGSIARLLDAGAVTPWPVQLTVQNEAMRLAVRGAVLNPLRATGYTLQLDATATDLAIVAPFLPPNFPPPHDASISAQFSDAGRGTPEITAITLHVGGLRLPSLPVGVSIVRADLAMAEVSQPLHADVQLALGDGPLHVVANVGSLAALLPGAPAESVPLDLTLDSGGATLTARGSAAVPVGLAGVDLTLSARIPDLASLAPLAGHALPAWKQIALDGQLSGTLGAGGAVALRKLVIATPQAQIEGDLDIGLGRRPSMRGALSASRIDLDGLLAGLAPPTLTPSASMPVTAPKADKAGWVIPDEPLGVAVLDRQDADVQLAIAALRSGGVTYGNIAGHLTMLNGRVTLDPFGGQTPGGRLEAKFAIDTRAAEPPIVLALHAPTIALQPIAAALGQPGAVSGVASIDVSLHGAGRTPHAIAAGLDGHLGIAIGDGEVDNRALGIVLGGVLKAARLPESALGNIGRTKLRCLAVRLDSRHGTVTVGTLVADATRVLVQGSGAFDLSQETLALHLRPLLRAGPGIVVPVQVTGGFHEPTLAPDLGGVKGGLLGSLAALTAADHGDACPAALAAVRGPDGVTATSPSASEPAASAKPPKPIDVLRGLLH